ncbi:hypothetical protein CVT25_015146 [Psilocybe cyanescens]|uniref:Uncharacterized protein n=1 Tax=Psilocybe cyanescens TaxID=93625 RepID=A0A409WUI6_PSICY|nr:hypothetical protein CVT25_015146 [Psilocybe cyanescens]
MSTTNTNPTRIYVGAIIAVVALSSAGIILRVMAVRRMRMAALARQNALAAPSTYPQSPQGPNAMGMQGYYTAPMQPPRSHSGNGLQNWNRYPHPEPAPPYQPPTSPPPASPRLNTPTTFPRTSVAFSPPPGPPHPVATVPDSTPRFPVPHTSPPSSPVPQPAPSFPLSPADIGAPVQTVESMSLVDRMREVQNLMLEIHSLEREPATADNRAKIQELQRRVTELSDVSDTQPTQQVPVTNPPREPPPYALDGRDGP